MFSSLYIPDLGRINVLSISNHFEQEYEVSMQEEAPRSVKYNINMHIWIIFGHLSAWGKYLSIELNLNLDRYCQKVLPTFG